MLVLGVGGIRSPKDHEAFLEIKKAIPILAHHASFLGRCLLALSFFRSIGLSRKVLEEFAVLVEVLHGVGVVGAWALHELVKVVRLALLGLLAHTIGHSDQSGVGRSAPILLVIFAPLRGGALALVLALGLAPILSAAEDHPEYLLAKGVVCGDVE